MRRGQVRCERAVSGRAVRNGRRAHIGEDVHGAHGQHQPRPQLGDARHGVVDGGRLLGQGAQEEQLVVGERLCHVLIPR